MTTIACGVLLLGVFAYVFWPERHSARQPQKTRLEFLNEADRLSTAICATSILNIARASIPKKTMPQRAGLENEAAEVLAEIDMLEAQAR